jgi:hypothetical protein
MAASTSSLTGDAPRSRRAMLAGALGGLGAWFAAAAAKAAPTEAAAGSALIVGSEANDAGTANTQLLTNSNVVAFKLLQNGPGTALMGYATPGSGGTRGVYGRTDSPDGDGVQARNAGPAGSGAGMHAFGGNNPGVIAETSALNTPAILATNESGGTGFAAGPGIRALSGGGVVGDIHPAGAYWDAAGEFAGPSGVIGASTGGGYGVLGLSTTAHGVRGVSTDGLGVVGKSVNNYAGYFEGRVFIDQYLDIDEIATPAAPVSNRARLFARDNAGKTELCVKFPGGNVVVLGTSV